MPAAFLAPALVVLRDQINHAFPNRSKASDGWIGDAAHRARKSEHNPDSDGCVRALDITDDPRNGCDASDIADAIRRSGDKRVMYVISDGKIANAGQEWRKYTGSNPHNKHFHVSVSRAGRLDKTPWQIGRTEDAMPVTKPIKSEPPVPAHPFLVYGAQGDGVVRLQQLLGIEDDGIFGPKTRTAVRAFQTKHKLSVDGKVGLQTWGALLAPKQ